MDEERLIVALEARIRDFERNMAKAERTGTRTYGGLQRRSATATRTMERDMIRSTTRINQALASTTSRIGAFGKAFAAGAVATGMAAITTGARTAVRSMAQLGDEAERAGVGVEEFQQWKYVAEQNRIGLDAMIDGLKELNLRADEFVVTGKGPAAEAFSRLGYEARDLKRALEDPNELLLDIIDRMQGLDTAGQIRVADEIFGGTAGERFVELLDQGALGIRRTMQQARETGAVLDAELIRKADELDRRFAALTASAGTFFKRVAVGAADAVADVTTLGTTLDDLFRSGDRARGILGDGVSDALEGDTEAVERNRDALIALMRQYAALANEAAGLEGQLYATAAQMQMVGRADLAGELNAAAQEVRRLAAGLEDGEISADEFEAQLGATLDTAHGALMELDAIDRAQFGGVISALGGLIERLGAAAARARELRASLPGSSPDGGTTPAVYSGRGGDPRTMGGSMTDWRSRTATDEAPATSIRPRDRAENDIDWDLPPVDLGGGGSSGGGGGSSRGGGGGAPRLSDYQEQVNDTREDIARLEMEAAELVAVAESGREVGDALDYARKRAELLYDAQESGRELTPELRAEIDALALAYTTAGKNAEDAAERLDLIEMHAERGADRMTDLFMSILDGSASAKDALRGLLMELAKIQMKQALLGLAESGGDGGVFGWVGGMLSGGRATGGPVRAGSAYMVNERTANSEVFVPSQSGGVLNVPQAQAALRGAGAAAPAPVVNVTNTVVNESGSRVEQRQNASGGMDIRIFDKAVSDSIGRGAQDRVQAQRFGRRPVPQGS